MPENESQNDDQNEHGLIPGSALPAISAKSSGPLDEMVERSLSSIRTSKELSAKHRIGEHELYGPDYHLACPPGSDSIHIHIELQIPFVVFDLNARSNQLIKVAGSE